MRQDTRRSERPPELRPGYLLAAALIWAAVIGAWLAPPAQQPVRMAKLECAGAQLAR